MPLFSCAFYVSPAPKNLWIAPGLPAQPNGLPACCVSAPKATGARSALPLYNLWLYAAYIEIKFFYYTSFLVPSLPPMCVCVCVLHFCLNYANFSLGNGIRFQALCRISRRPAYCLVDIHMYVYVSIYISCMPGYLPHFPILSMQLQSFLPTRHCLWCVGKLIDITVITCTATTTTATGAAAAAATPAAAAALPKVKSPLKLAMGKEWVRMGKWSGVRAKSGDLS